MVCESMFDEVNEGTAIFKCTDNPLAGTSPFLTFEGLPSDFYLEMRDPEGDPINARELSMEQLCVEDLMNMPDGHSNQYLGLGKPGA